jgi:hypothetical protein
MNNSNRKKRFVALSHFCILAFLHYNYMATTWRLYGSYITQNIMQPKTFVSKAMFLRREWLLIIKV